jgi:SAM-dependent methyltransferase
MCFAMVSNRCALQSTPSRLGKPRTSHAVYGLHTKVSSVTVDAVREAYSRRAAEYVEVVGKIEHAAMQDREYLLAWARGVEGLIIDAGCGPGQWTNYLQHKGIDIEGIDPVATFVDGAKKRYPSARYRVGRAEDLGVHDGSLGGVLAWFSLIHTAPNLIDEPLAEFARCIKPGGSLLIGFFDGAQREAFEHAVTTAYYWSVDALTEHVARAGFVMTDARTRTDPGVRPQGVIVAKRLGQR